eukprot:TRINITY_DN91141_c0_g1_i1.p1 TRINITY_DN91141_c0_g1~~TRINITY_DN91141_c0_g1_i1.p1  ORF type:complete len:475 (-),score=68.97 TRINITY_DN91141_c0_g1_i1:114-1538(-)
MPFAFEIFVSSLGGGQYTISADSRWSLNDLKASVEVATGMPAREQRFLAGTVELRSHPEVCAQLAYEQGDGPLHLQLIRRSREQLEFIDSLQLPGGKHGTYYTSFPILALASDGGQLFLTAGGGGRSAYREVPNMVESHRYDKVNGKLLPIASLSTGSSVVHYLAYSQSLSLWLACVGSCCRVLELFEEQNALTELCEWDCQQEGGEPQLNVAKWSCTGRLVATGGTDGIVRIWSVIDPQESPTLERACTQTGEIYDLDFSLDETHLASCDRSGACRLWNVTTGDEVLHIQYDAADPAIVAKGVRFVADCDGASLLLAATGPHGPSRLGLFGIDGTRVKDQMVHTSPLSGFDVDGSRRWACVSLVTGSKAVYALPDLQQVKKVGSVHELPGFAVTFLGTATAVTGSGDRSIHVLNFQKTNQMQAWLWARSQVLFAVLVLALCWLLLNFGLSSSHFVGSEKCGKGDIPLRVDFEY